MIETKEQVDEIMIIQFGHLKAHQGVGFCNANIGKSFELIKKNPKNHLYP